MKRIEIIITGVVQGVGFRPFVYRVARKHNIRGFVKNTIAGLIIEAEGKIENVENFLKEIKEGPPVSARIKSVYVRNISVKNSKNFLITKSNGDLIEKPEIPPDIAICPQCRNEIIDSKNRRFWYPFTNCVDCGPRFTIIDKLPYDRENTTMRSFKMCKECLEEYKNPENRRFHAQTNCCEKCGPQVFLTDRHGRRICESRNAIEQAGYFLLNAKIVAVKGIGGFHLACDAVSITAVKNLRTRKGREEKPFALMARDIETIRKYCELSDTEIDYLVSPAAPIILLKKKGQKRWFDYVAPGNKYLGVMLPYSGIHQLIFESNPDIELLVMTSGNISEEPICIDNEEAIKRLSGIADYFLFHDRTISSGCDDSVMRIFPDRNVLITRRSRGYAPESMMLPFTAKKQILACGADNKNVFGLVSKNNLYLSHHIGDLEHVLNFESYRRAIEKYVSILKIKPDLVVYDAHPEYFSSSLAMSDEFFKEAKKIPIFHHHAHVCSSMIENHLPDKPVLGLAFDGTGYGADGTLWGSEFLLSDYKHFQRLAHLKYVRLPGGERAIKQIWRIAVSYLVDAFDGEIPAKFFKNIDANKVSFISDMIKKGINSPYACGLGRIFDAVSCLCGIRNEANYEGQAAIELEAMLTEGRNDTPVSYDFDITRESGQIVIDHKKIIRGVVDDLLGGKDAGSVSYKFHLTVVKFTVDVCHLLREQTHISDVVFSGGSFQNVFLYTNIKRMLEKDGFKVYSHKIIPTNDGGIAAGQCAIANFTNKP
ncbi:MAG TPA: carbamoyltransferase HypF [bacterium]|nr:carbamoyltransferase HypF [bacterium]HOL49681.1 carbamoyltransferase HypF [bacterium]HPO52399.1 carbamoyltransferase HypF [bacterium]